MNIPDYPLSDSIRKRVRRLAIPPIIAAIIPKYLASQRASLDDAKARLTVNDLEPVGRFGHNLKGTGRGYGFIELEQIGRCIERAADCRDEESLRAQLELLRRFLNDPEMY